MATVQRWTGRETRALRQAMRLGVRDFATSLGVAVRTVTKWEAQGSQASLRPDSHALLDTVLQRASGEIQARFELSIGPVAGQSPDLPRRTVDVGDRQPPRQRPTPSDDTGQPAEDREMRRRRVLEFAALSIAAAGPSVALEALRHDLIQAVAADPAASLAEWEAVAWDYGSTYATTPPAVLLEDLVVDLLVARDHLDRVTDEPSKRAMLRVIALLDAFLAQTWGNLGNIRAGRRWWRTARATADKSRDPEIQTWIRGREVIRGLCEGWPLAVVLERANEAVALVARPGMGTGSVLIGRAQVLAAMGRAAEARTAMADVYRAMDRFPDRVTNDVTSMYGWPEYRLRHGESFVYTYLGDARRAVAAQDRALALYPAHMFRARAQVELHQALRMVRSGDTTAGAVHAQRIVNELPEWQRIAVVLEGARTVAQSVPTAEQHRPEVTALRELLTLATTPGSR